MKSLTKLCFVPRNLVVAVLVMTVSATSGKAQSTFGADNLTLLGFTLGKTEIGEMERTLRVAQAVAAPEHEMTQRCYESENPIPTTVIFRDWVGTLSGFTVYQAKRSNPLCTKTSMVTASLSTGAGLKLGLTREQVVSLLGRPTKQVGKSFIYKDESEKRLTSEDIARFKQAHPGESISDLHIWNFTEVKLGFAKSKLSSIEVIHTETT